MPTPRRKQRFDWRHELGELSIQVDTQQKEKENGKMQSNHESVHIHPGHLRRFGENLHLPMHGLQSSYVKGTTDIDPRMIQDEQTQ